MAMPPKKSPLKTKKSGVPKGYHKSKSGAIKANVGGQKRRATGGVEFPGGPPKFYRKKGK